MSDLSDLMTRDARRPAAVGVLVVSTLGGVVALALVWAIVSPRFW